MELTPGILDLILGQFDGALRNAIPALEEDVSFVFRSFLIISIVISGIAYASGWVSDGMALLLKKIILMTGSIFLLTAWLDFTEVMLGSFGLLGLKAGGTSGQTLAINQFFSPSTILSLGLDLGSTLFFRAGESGGVFGLTVNGLVLAFAALCVSLSFLVIALQVFVTLLEFKLVTLGGFILLPFALLERTEALAQGVLGYVISAGIKIFVLAVVVSFAFVIFPTIRVPPNIEFSTQITIIGTSLVFMMLALRAPGVASSVITGGPSLGIGALAQTAGVAGAVGSVAWFGSKAAIGRAGQVVSSGRAGLQGRIPSRITSFGRGSDNRGRRRGFLPRPPEPSGGGGGGGAAGASQRFSSQPSDPGKTASGSSTRPAAKPPSSNTLGRAMKFGALSSAALGSDANIPGVRIDISSR